MKEKFHEFIVEIARSLDMTHAFEQDGILASIRNDALTINTAYRQSDRSMIFLTGIALAPQHEKEVFFAKILEWNTAFSHAQGFSYGYDEENELITLQWIFPLENVSIDDVFMPLAAYIEEIAHSYSSAEALWKSLV